MTATTPGGPGGSRPRMSSASVRTSPPPAPSARWPTNATPSTSSAAAASSPRRRRAAAATRDLLDLLLRGAQPLDDVVDPLGQLLGPRLERLAELGDEHVLARQEPVGVAADQRLDAAYAGADRRLAEQLDHAELAGAAGVRAAAELARPVADRDHAHLVAVLLAEQRHRAGLRPPRPGVMISACTPRSASTRSLTRASTSAITDAGTAPVAEKSKRNRPGAFSEPGLGRGLAERLAERLVHHVGRGVRAADRACAARRRRATAPRAPTVTSPLSTLAWCTTRPVIGDCTSRTSSRAPLSSSITPWSASWPPPSA